MCCCSKLNCRHCVEIVNVQLQRLLPNVRVKIDSDANFKLAPSGLGKLKRSSFHSSGGFLKAGVELKHDLLDKHTQIFVVCASNIRCPLVRAPAIGNRARSSTKKSVYQTTSSISETRKAYTYSAAFFPSQNAMEPYTMGIVTSTPFTLPTIGCTH